MQNVITIGRELIPVEQIAYVEQFEPPTNGQFRPDQPYKGRVVHRTLTSRIEIRSALVSSS